MSAEPMTPSQLAGTRISLVLRRDYKPEIVESLLATVDERDGLIRELRPRCRYLDRREAEYFRNRIAAAVGGIATAESALRCPDGGKSTA